MKTVPRSPTRLSVLVSGSVAIIALGLSAFYSWPALGIGSLGLLIHAAGLIRGSNSAVTIGAFALFNGAVIAGAQSAPVVPVLISATCSVLAWDIGGSAISIGRQLGRDAETRRIEVVHIMASSAVGVITAGVGYGLYQTGSGDQPIAALLFLLVAAVLLIEALN